MDEPNVHLGGVSVYHSSHHRRTPVSTGISATFRDQYRISPQSALPPTLCSGCIVPRARWPADGQSCEDEKGRGKSGYINWALARLLRRQRRGQHGAVRFRDSDTLRPGLNAVDKLDRKMDLVRRLWPLDEPENKSFAQSCPWMAVRDYLHFMACAHPLIGVFYLDRIL